MQRLPQRLETQETNSDKNQGVEVSMLTENTLKKVQEPLIELQVFQFRHLLCAWLFY